MPCAHSDLGAQLPTLVRGVYYEGWNPAGKPETARSLDEFLDRVQVEFPRGVEMDTRRATEVVFALLARRISAGEAEDVRGMLPGPVRALWPSREAAS